MENYASIVREYVCSDLDKATILDEDWTNRNFDTFDLRYEVHIQSGIVSRHSVYFDRNFAFMRAALEIMEDDYDYISIYMINDNNAQRIAYFACKKISSEDICVPIKTIRSHRQNSQ